MMVIYITMGARETPRAESDDERDERNRICKRTLVAALEAKYPGAHIMVTIFPRIDAELSVAVSRDRGATPELEAEVYRAATNALGAAYRAAAALGWATHAGRRARK